MSKSFAVVLLLLLLILDGVFAAGRSFPGASEDVNPGRSFSKDAQEAVNPAASGSSLFLEANPHIRAAAVVNKHHKPPHRPLPGPLPEHPLPLPEHPLPEHPLPEHPQPLPEHPLPLPEHPLPEHPLPLPEHPHPELPPHPPLPEKSQHRAP